MRTVYALAVCAFACILDISSAVRQTVPCRVPLCYGDHGDMGGGGGEIMAEDDSQKDEKAQAEKDDGMDLDVVDKLLRKDAERFLNRKEVDDPQETRRWFDQMIEQLEREGLDDTAG